jgi:hypothetical protein
MFSVVVNAHVQMFTGNSAPPITREPEISMYMPTAVQAIPPNHRKMGKITTLRDFPYKTQHR